MRGDRGQQWAVARASRSSVGAAAAAAARARILETLKETIVKDSECDKNLEATVSCV